MYFPAIILQVTWVYLLHDSYLGTTYMINEEVQKVMKNEVQIDS